MSAAPNRTARRLSRLYAVQAMFQMEAAKSPLEATIQEFEDHRFGATTDQGTFEEGDPAHFRTLVRAAFTHQARIDQATDVALVDNWPLGRVDPTVRAIFRVAGAEFLDSDTPVKVVLSEFVDLAASFFPEGREPKFVNGVLDHMGRALVPDRFAA